VIAAPGSAERAARNAALKVLGQATRFGSLVLVIVTARVLGPAEFGKFSFAYALATVLGIVLDFGISVVLTRAVARDPGATAERWGTASTLKLLLLGLIGPVYLAVPLLMHRSWDTTAAVWLLGLAIALQTFLENAVSVFTAVQRLEQEFQMRLLEKGVLVTVGFAALGLAVTAIVPNADAAPPVVNVTILPILFLSDIFIPLGEDSPAWVDFVGLVFPVRHFSEAMQAGFIGTEFEWSDVVRPRATVVDVLSAFVALLELARRNLLRLGQREPFGPMVIRRAGADQAR